MKYTHISETERLELSILKSKGYSFRQIAKTMNRSHTSLSREFKENEVSGSYNAKKANHKAYVKRKYSKYQGMKVADDNEIESFVKKKMEEGWSPANIAGRFSFEKGRRILGKDAIYKYLYSAYGQPLCVHLKYKRYRRRKRKNIKVVREIIKDRVFIDQRPEIINQRIRFGDFEGDTMGRPKTASHQTLVVVRERFSRKIFAIKVPRLKYSIYGFMALLRGKNVLSLTLDNGVENIKYKLLKLLTYFCHPYHSWEKGSVEQGIGLIREYIPKKADLNCFSQRKIDAILQKINDTPMKCLGFKTPNEVYNYNQNLLSLNSHKWCT